MPTSPNNTIVTSAGAIITDASGNRWQIANAQVVVNGIADPTTGHVVVLAYENGKIWQMNSNRLWWSKSKPSDAWGPTYGTAVSPLINVASPDNTVLVGSVQTSLFPHSITDANDDRWSITPNGQIAVNGIADATTKNVIAIAYEKGLIWQENASHLWWSKVNAASSWQPVNGTPISPIPSNTAEPVVTYFDGDIVNYVNTATPVKYSVLAVSDGDKGISFNYSGQTMNAGLIRNVEGTLRLNIAGTMISSGTITTQGGIGNAYTTINLAASSTFSNTGLINMLSAGVGKVGGHLVVSGSGTFRNTGTILIDGGSSTDFAMSGSITNAGLLTISDSFGTTHSIVTSGNITNSGTIQNHNRTTIQFGYVGPPRALPLSTFTNNGVIQNLYDVGQLILAAGAFAHNADGNVVHDYHGTLVNNRQIIATGGGDEIEIAAPLTQAATGVIDIQSGATVQLDSTSSGGTIVLTSGMLAFGGDRITFHGPAGASGFHSTVVLNGASAAFNFGRTDISEIFKSTAPGSADLLIGLTGAHAPEQIADIHLAGAYHASQFHLSGSEVIYTQSG